MRKWYLVGGALLVLPVVASAQWKFTPYGGVYAPANDLASLSASGGGVTANAALKQKTGFVLGANASKWITDRAGFEATAGYVWSDLRASGSVSGPGGFAGSGSESAYLFLTNAKVLMRITPKESEFDLNFGLGPSVIFAGGTAYDEVDGAKIERGTNVGGVASVGFGYQITQLIGLKLGAESYLYSTKMKLRDSTDPTNNFDFESRFQTDFVISGGLSFTLPMRSR